MIPIINSISVIIASITSIVMGLTILRLLRQVNALSLQTARLEQRLLRLKCLEDRPKGDAYRTPPACDSCPESSPAACQVCHEEEEAYIRRGV